MISIGTDAGIFTSITTYIFKLPLTRFQQLVKLFLGRDTILFCIFIRMIYDIFTVNLKICRPQCTTWQPKINVFCITDTKIDRDMILTILIPISVSISIYLSKCFLQNVDDNNYFIFTDAKLRINNEMYVRRYNFLYFFI